MTSQKFCISQEDEHFIQLALKCDISSQKKATWFSAFVGFVMIFVCLIFGVLYKSTVLISSAVFLGILTPCIVVTRLRFLRLIQIIRCLIAKREGVNETAPGPFLRK